MCQRVRGLRIIWLRRWGRFEGDQPISYETANKLELATNVPALMWNNLEAQYREQLAKV
jgi:hypothetical protein